MSVERRGRQNTFASYNLSFAHSKQNTSLAPFHTRATEELFVWLPNGTEISISSARAFE
jgi:hypothetical protein